MNERTIQRRDRDSSGAVVTGRRRRRRTRGAIAVIAKCPIPGKSKTRLIPLLGTEGSAKLAKAMLSDILLTLDQCSALNGIQKMVFYAPGNDNGRYIMTNILKEELNLNVINSKEDEDDKEEMDYKNDSDDGGWKLLPLISKTTTGNDLQSSDLGELLEYALERSRRQIFVSDDSITNNNNIIDDDDDSTIQEGGSGGGSVVFLGMDSPILPLDDIVTGLLEVNNNNNTALLCPADDGGYGMLSVPSNVSSNHVFRNIVWSNSLTGMSQLKALTDLEEENGVVVKIGKLMHDIDEPDDVHKLCQRLLVLDEKDDKTSREGKQDAMVLHTSAKSNLAAHQETTIHSTHPICYHTKKALIESGLLTAAAAAATETITSSD